ncbi:MAG TPA: CARDB domain-containing protein, partial [Nitrospiria bacterium]|nr:CARDB domain-containing protein [Nitrospiria bacterium]
LFDPGTFHCSGSCLTFTDSTLVAHHVAGLTGLQSNKRYWVINEATSAHGTTRSTYAYSFKTKPGSVGSIPPRIYLSDPEGGSNDRVMIIDPVTNTQILPSIVVTGNNPTELASHPDASAVYVMAGKNLSVIDVPTNSEFASLSGAGDSSNHLAVSSDGHRLYLVYRDLLNSTLKIKVYDTTDSHSPSLVTTISDPVFNGCAAPLGIVVSPDGSQVYTACRPTVSSSPDQFYMVDTASNTPTITATFTRDSTNNTSINAMAITPDGSEVFVARDDGSGGGHATVEVFDGGTGSNIGSIILPASALPRAGVVSPDGSTLYVADQVLGTHIIDAVANTYVSTMTMATSRGFDIGITPDGTRLYTSLLFDVFVNSSGGSPVATITGSFNDAMQLTVTPGVAPPPTPDVLMTDVTPNATGVSPGQTLSVTDTVKNQGTGSTDSSFLIGYSLSPDTTYGNGDDIAITTTRVVGPLAAGATDTATTSLLIPGSAAPGTYHLCATADSTGALAESNVDNNALCSTVTIQVTQPDLVMTAVTPNSGSYVAGSTLSVTDTMQNQGGAPTTVSSTVGYSLSTNTTYGDGDDIAITTTRVVGPLGAGASSTATTNLLIPASTPSGTYYVCAKADSGSAVNESNETNNSLCSTVTVSPGSADLIISAASTTATAAAPGGKVTLSNSAKNQGVTSAGSFIVAFHLSTNATYGDGDDVALTATRTVASLGAGGTSTASTSLVIPSTTTPGNYYICVLADRDNTVSETNETNNTRCTAATIQVVNSDLITTAVTPNAGTVSATATLSVTNSVKNQSVAAVPVAFKVGFVLSPTASYTDPGAVASTTTRSVSTLAAGATSTATTTVTFPNTTPPGNYYVCVKADSANAVTESDETNNTFCSAATVTVPAADLIMSAVSATVFSVSPGANISFSNTAKNQGLFPAGTFTIAYHLSTNTIYGDGDDVTVTQTRTVASLAVGASNANTTTLTVPLTTPLGTYYVCAMADSGNTITESNESNNSLCTATATLTVTLPDLIVTAVTPAASVLQGGTLTETNTIKNQGGATAVGFVTNFHLSTDATYGGADDIVLTPTQPGGSIAAGASSNASTSLTIAATVPAGIYYLCEMADYDNRIPEISETNNALCSTTTVTVLGPDLIVSAIGPAPASGGPGITMNISNSVKNTGAAETGAFQTAFHFSTDTTYGNGDDVASPTLRQIVSLGTNVTSTATTGVAVPGTLPVGLYYVCAMTDSTNVVAESNETNNSLCTTTTVIMGPDLIFTALTGPASGTHVAQGANFNITDTVKNQGGATTVTSSLNAYHLSTDTTYGNGDDIAIVATRTVGVLTGGSSSGATTPLTVPATTPNGTYYICAMADSTSIVTEANETNNTACTSTTITVP